MPAVSRRSMRGFTTALILVTAGVTSGLNDCFDPDNDLFVCPAGSTLIDLDNCAIGNDELVDLAECFDNVGRSSVEVITMNGNSLTTLPGGEDAIFMGFDNVRSLLLNQNNIETINAGSFEGLGALTYLGIIQSKLTTLPVGGFDGLGNLETMTLYGNDLAMIPVGAFRDLGELESLSLAGNALSTLPAGVFDGLGSLTVLDLSENDNLECVPSLAGSPGYSAQEWYLPEGFGDGGTCSCPEEGALGACTPASACLPGEDGYTCTDDTAPESDDTVLVDARARTTVSQYSSAYDARGAEDGGCDPNGCTAALTRDDSLGLTSRWSCSKKLADAQCTITYEFEEPQDIVSLGIKFYKGDERVRTLKVTDNTGFRKVITSSGTADGYEYFEVNTDETSWMRMESLNLDSNGWISITEVEFMVA